VNTCITNQTLIKDLAGEAARYAFYRGGFEVSQHKNGKTSEFLRPEVAD